MVTKTDPFRWKARVAPPKVPTRVLKQIGRELIGCRETVKDESTFARHRDREAEFRAKMKRELEEYREWLEDRWPQAA